ncbi:SANT/Myb domain [Macleaya cordata]|uniref:SANT/Myb domain n=1 Tax=Macleaya cordata TaxID=56857 RepID=A0A200R5W5_MACCD|nr:SANT/Myb domain [Macleaya cordata]
MPSEPLPWDRKDFYKRKRHERSDAIIYRARWKESHHKSSGFARCRGHEFRRPLGHGKQGFYHQFSEEPGHGCMPSRSRERMVEENSSRPSACRDRKFCRGSRENWQGSSLAIGFGTVNSSGMPQDLIAKKRSLSDQLTYSSHHHSNNENFTSEKINSKGLHDKMGGSDGLATDQKHEKDLPWEPLKWTRSSSLSSRSSVFSRSSSSRSFGEDLDEKQAKLLLEKVDSVQSLSGDVAIDRTSAASFEETCALKKQRLGWGQGLAKYEKKRVEGSDDTISKNGVVLSSGNTVMCNSVTPILPDRNPSVTAVSGCASPVTPSSMSCSSSPAGIDISPEIEVANNRKDTSHCSPVHVFQYFQGVLGKVEHFELNPITDLSSLLIDLLQPEDASLGDSSFLRSTVTNKLLLLKSEILKTLEKTETELDIFENELKFLNSESVTSGPHPTSDSSSVDCTKSCEEAGSASKVLQKHAPVTLVSSVNTLVETPLVCTATVGGFCAEVKGGYVDSPGIATAKFVESHHLEKSISASIMVKSDEFYGDYQAATFTSTEGRHFMPSFLEKKLGGESGTLDVNHLNENESSTTAHVYRELGVPSDAEGVVNVSILASNRDSAREASEMFIKLLPTDQAQIDIWEASIISCRQNVSLVKEKLAIRKCFRRFKKRVLALKFKILRHLWKEDMRLLSVRKYRAKSQKRYDSCSKTSSNGYKKHGSSIRLRFTSSAGNLSLLPATEILGFNSKLLLDSEIKLYRSTLKMPALILDEMEKSISRFVTSNGLVEDPCAVEKERLMINPWMPKEKEVFMEMLTIFGKDFKRIASFLDHKTTADCIEFYYKNQKSECFDDVKKKLEVKKQGKSFLANTYLVPSGKKWKPDVNAASLDMLGAASVMAANADGSMKIRQTCAGRSSLGGYYDYRKPQVKNGVLKSSRSAEILCNGSPPADVFSGVCGALSLEAMSSFAISFVDPGKISQESKSRKANSATDRTSTVTHKVDDEETFSDECCGDLDYVDWTNEEKSIFVQAMRSYGKDFAKISKCVGSRSMEQCKIFFCKARKCLGLDPNHLVPDHDGTPASVTNIGRRDTKTAMVGEMESAILSTQSCFKKDMDLSLSGTNTNGTVLGYAEGMDGIEQLDCDYAGTEKERVGMKPDVIFQGEKNLVERVEEKSSATAGVLQCNGSVTADAALSCQMPVQLYVSACLNSDAGGATGLRTSETITPFGDFKVQAVAGDSAEGLKTESDRRDAESSASTNCHRSRSFSIQDSNAISSASHLAAEMSIHPGFSSSLNSQKQIFLKVIPSVEKPQFISWEKESCPSIPSNSVVEDSSFIHFEDPLRHATISSKLSFDEYESNHYLKSSGQDAIQNHLLGHNSSYRVGSSSQILTGYALQGLNKKETNADADSVSRENHFIDQHFSEINTKSESNQSFVQNLSHENCNGLNRHSVSELTFLPKSGEQSSSENRRANSRSSSDTAEHSNWTADVKLFGKVLSHISPVQNPIPTSHKTDDKLSIPKLSSKSFNLTLNGHGTNGTLVPSKLDASNYSGLEGFPMKSHGFWDGNRMQTGLTSIPDSAVQLTEFSADVGDISASCRVLDKQPVPSVVKEKERNLGSMSVFPSKDQGLTDYQVYRSSKGTNVKPFKIDVKQCDVFPELQKCNGFGTESGFQQGGIAVGGGCNDISDPIAAVKLHYSAAEQYGWQVGEESGDLKG